MVNDEGGGPDESAVTIVDLLSAAKLLADSQANILLSYIINMAMIEASTGAANRKNEGEKSDASAA